MPRRNHLTGRISSEFDFSINRPVRFSASPASAREHWQLHTQPMGIPAIRVGAVVSGPLVPEPIEVIAVAPLRDSIRLFGKGLHTGRALDIVLSAMQQAQLVVSADQPVFDGDARMFRLGIEAQRLGLAYEYDPFFSLSIARVDPAAAPA